MSELGDLPVQLYLSKMSRSFIERDEATSDLDWRSRRETVGEYQISTHNGVNFDLAQYARMGALQEVQKAVTPEDLKRPSG